MLRACRVAPRAAVGTVIEQLIGGFEALFGIDL